MINKIKYFLSALFCLTVFTGFDGVSAQSGSVAGSYEYNTYKGKKEGFINTLDVAEKGNGKISFSINGTYIYQANGAETFKETAGAGEGFLRGETALVELLNENEEKCSATVSFAANEAIVKTSAECRFNVNLDGVYKKTPAKSDAGAGKSEASTMLREIPFSKLMDFVNDEKNHRPGERYIITKISPTKLEKKVPADKESGADYKNLFYLEENDDDGYASTALLVSGEMVEKLRSNAKIKPVFLRMAATLIESRDKTDWHWRMSYISKIEGLDKAGKVLWTATSAEPSKVNFNH